MIQLNDNEKELISRLYPFMTVKPRSIKVDADFTAVIPSKEFPLSKRETRIFDYFNTGCCDYPELAEVFNNTKFYTGHCYSNTQRLIENCKQAGIKGVKPYAGWLVGNDGMVIHHAWAVFEADGHSHLLDGGNFRDLFLFIKESNGDRAKVIERMKEADKLPNTEKAIYGWGVPNNIYVGSRTDPEEALDIWDDLCRRYPNHIAYSTAGQNQHGASKFQEQMAQAGLQ